MSTIQVRVAARTAQAIDIDSFELVRVDGAALPPFTAGAHIDVHLDGGLVRQYSLCNAPGDTARYRIGVLKDANSRGGSQRMHRLQVGDTLPISAPRNLFALDEAAEYSLLFAGGIGITPILCMAQALHSQGRAFELHYCARTAERAAFVEELRASAFADQVQLHFDDGPTPLNLGQVLQARAPGVHLYVCGPTGFMDAVLDTASTAGWAAEQLHREYFSAPVVEHSGERFEVVIASTGASFPVPEDKSVVEVLAEQGIEVPVSCEQGICGTCLTRVLEGVPDHRDMFMTQDEHARNDRFTPCCSRSRSARLVLDL